MPSLVLVFSTLLATGCVEYRDTPVRLVDWPGADSEPAREEFPDWAFRMRLWPFDILEPDMADGEIGARLDDAVDHHADTVIFYIESEHMYGSFVDEAGFEAALDRTGVLVAGARERDLRTIVYLNGLEVMTAGAYDADCQPTGTLTMAGEHAAWLQEDLRSQPIVFTCQDADWLEPDWEDAWMSPLSDYRELFRERLVSLAGAGVDAVYIDATFLPGFQPDEDHLVWGSSDPAFEAAFEAATGQALPEDGDHDSDAFRAFAAFRHDVLADYLGDLAASARDEGLVAFWESSTADTPEGTLLGNETAVTGRAGLGLSPEIEPEGDWVAAWRMAKSSRELNGGRPLIYLGWPESRRQARIELATALAHSNTWYPTADSPLPRHADTLLAGIDEVLARRVPYWGDTVLVYSVRNKDATWEDETTFELYAEVSEELAAWHQPFRIAALEYLGEDGVDGARTAVLPGIQALSDGEAALLAGLDVVVWGDATGTRHADWTRRDSPVSLGPKVELDDVLAPLPFEIQAPAGASIEYYTDRDGDERMYLFVVSASSAGHVTLRAAPDEGLAVQTWNLEGEHDEDGGRKVKVRLDSELTVISVGPE